MCLWLAFPLILLGHRPALAVDGALVLVTRVAGPTQVGVGVVAAVLDVDDVVCLGGLDRTFPGYGQMAMWPFA